MTMLFALLSMIQATQPTPVDLTNQVAHQPTQQERVETSALVAAPEAPPRVICHRESIPGSNRQHRVCTTEQQRDDSRESARRLMEHISSGERDDGVQGVASN